MKRRKYIVVYNAFNPPIESRSNSGFRVKTIKEAIALVKRLNEGKRKKGWVWA